VPLEDCCPYCGEELAFCECWEADPFLEELDDIVEQMNDDDDDDEFGGGRSGGAGGGSSY